MSKLRFARHVTKEELTETMAEQLRDVPNMRIHGSLKRSDLRRLLQLTERPLMSEGCVLWRGQTKTLSKPGKQHGYFKFGRHSVRVARLIYHNFKAFLPEDYGNTDANATLVLHRCQTQGRCVNPDHLYTGNYQQNLLDRSFHANNPGELVPSVPVN